MGEKEALERALRKFINQKMFAAWNAWRSWAAEMRRQQKMMGGAVRRMIYRKISMAWEKWQQVYADQKFAMRMGGGAIRRMMNRKLSMAWEQWQQVSQRCVPSVRLLTVPCVGSSTPRCSQPGTPGVHGLLRCAAS